jgi:hypothetical protein
MFCIRFASSVKPGECTHAAKAALGGGFGGARLKGQDLSGKLSAVA